MKAYVLDASVAAKWFLPAAGEPFSDQAIELLNQYALGNLNLMVPDLFWPELGNILWKAVRSRRISAVAAERALLQLQEMMHSTFPTRPLIEHAFTIATSFGQTVYDSTYVALAVANNAPFITADERLLTALGPWLPMQWLGTF